MAKKVFDIGKRLQNAFGYLVEQNAGKMQKAGFTDMSTGAEIMLKDTANFEAVNFKWGEKEQISFGFGGFKLSGTTYLAPPPMCSFSRAKRLGVTVMEDSEDEVVEKYGKEPWRITIQGILVDTENHNYPRENVALLNDFFSINDTVTVEGQMFYDLGIHSIYFTNIQIANVQGFEDTVSFTLEASSNRPAQYYLKNNKRKF